MLIISNTLSIPENEFVFSAVRSQGAGGQNVNKVASAIHLRFDIINSSIPDYYKKRLLAMRDSRLSKEGVIIIKSQEYRNQKKNKEAAISRLRVLIQSAITVQKKRKPSKPSKNSQKKRMDSKTKHGQNKKLRGKVKRED